MKLVDIYFISNGRNIKIGLTSNITSRKRTLQTGNDSQLTLLYVIEKVPSSLETTLHEMCRQFHVQGEWYTFDAIDHVKKHPWYRENLKPITN